MLKAAKDRNASRGGLGADTIGNMSRNGDIWEKNTYVAICIA